MCKILGVNFGSYNNWKSRSITERQKWKMIVNNEIESIFLASQKRYGSKRVKAELEKSGYNLSADTVRLYMRELNLVVAVKKHRVIL